MELFDQKFVHFMWTDELKGKEGFFSNNICSLIGLVNNNLTRKYITEEEFEDWNFVYYDPNYECKRAYAEGKQIQVKNGNDWIDICGEIYPTWDLCNIYRIKPMKFIVYSDCPSHYFINSEDDTISDKWEKMFEGTEKECKEWIQNRLEEDNTFESADLYKKYCANCKHSSLDGRCYPCNDCYEGSRVDNKTYIPYDDTNELIRGYCDRFKVATLNHRLPTIWIISKETNEWCLIIKYSEDKVYTDMWIDLKTLLDEFTFADNTVIGKVKK